MNEGAPSAVAAVREAIKGQQKQIQDRYGTERRRLKEQRDQEMDRLKRALRSLDAEEEGVSSPVEQKSRSRRRARASTTPAAVRERCDAVLRFLAEQSAPLSRSAICGSLDLSPSVVSTALKLLTAEKQVRSVGTGAATRYAATERKPQPEAVSAASNGTPQGRIATILQERSWASTDELAQAAGVPREEAQRACKALEHEGEIYATKRDGRAVYAIVSSAT